MMLALGLLALGLLAQVSTPCPMPRLSPCHAQRQQGPGRQGPGKAPPSPLATFHPQGKAQAYPCPTKARSSPLFKPEENRHPQGSKASQPSPARPRHPLAQAGPSQQAYGGKPVPWIRTTPLAYAAQD